MKWGDEKLTFFYNSSSLFFSYLFFFDSQNKRLKPNCNLHTPVKKRNDGLLTFLYHGHVQSHTYEHTQTRSNHAEKKYQTNYWSMNFSAYFCRIENESRQNCRPCQVTREYINVKDIGFMLQQSSTFQRLLFPPMTDKTLLVTMCIRPKRYPILRRILFYRCCLVP